MPPKDCELAAAVHTMVTEEAPQLDAPTFYGMHAWEGADGTMWTTSYAIQEPNEDTRARIRELIRRAVY